MQNWEVNQRPRLSGLFNILVGVFLLLVSYGFLLYSTVILPPPNPGGPVITSFTPYPFYLGPLYIFIGVGFALAIYSLKLIVFGILALNRKKSHWIPTSHVSTDQVPRISEESKKSTAPSFPTPVQNASQMSTGIERCSYCGAELPTEASYCPNCFQKRRPDSISLKNKQVIPRN